MSNDVITIYTFLFEYDLKWSTFKDSLERSLNWFYFLANFTWRDKKWGLLCRDLSASPRMSRLSNFRKETIVFVLAIKIAMAAFSTRRHRNSVVSRARESLWFSWDSAVRRIKGRENQEKETESGEKGTPPGGGESFFRFTNWFNFFWKSGWTPREPVVSTPRAETMERWNERKKER